MQESERPARTNPRLRGTSPGVQIASRTLRHELTAAEKKLWQSLKNRQLGNLKFRRQHPVGRFILDFYCAEHRLVVEVDGGVHDERVEHDAERSRVIEEYGYRVVRFQNQQIMHRLDEVLASILAAVVRTGETR